MTRPGARRGGLRRGAPAAPGTAAAIRAVLVAGALVALVAGCHGGRAASDPAGRSAPPPATASHPARAARPTYYLSLGDSLAFGFQRARLTRLIAAGRYAPAAFPGYTVPVARRLARLRGRAVTVDYGCPGETTATFRSGGCPFRLLGVPLHDPYEGGQLAAAVRFLAAHRGRTALVTLSLGANDLAPLETRCGPDPRCLAAGLPALARRTAAAVGAAVTRLRAADPAARVVVLEVYDPLAAVAPGSVALLGEFDRRLAAAARAAGARAADALTAVNGRGRQPATVCRLTLYCGPARDVHPSDAGYAVLADVLWRAAGLAG